MKYKVTIACMNEEEPSRETVVYTQTVAGEAFDLEGLVRVVNTKTDRNVRLELKVKQGQSGQQGRSVLRNQNGQTSLLAKIAPSAARHHHLICSAQVSPAWSASGWK